MNVDTVWINGAAYPLTWTTLTNWTVTVPLANGTNNLSVVGVDQKRPADRGRQQQRQRRLQRNQCRRRSARWSSTKSCMLRRSTTRSLWNCTITPPTRRLICRAGSLQGLAYTFPNGSILAPTNYLVLAANGAAFAAAYGATNPVFDIFSGTLPPSGILALNTASNVTVAEVEYENQLPWPTNANGTGASLQLIDPHQDNWRVGNWSLAPFTATPGRAQQRGRLADALPVALDQ